MGYHFLVLSVILGVGVAATLVMLIVLRHLQRQRCIPKQYSSTSFLGRYRQSVIVCMLILFEVAMFVILFGLVFGWLGGMGCIHFTIEDMDSANRFERNTTILCNLFRYAPFVAISLAYCLVFLVQGGKKRG